MRAGLAPAACGDDRELEMCRAEVLRCEVNYSANQESQNFLWPGADWEAGKWQNKTWKFQNLHVGRVQSLGGPERAPGFVGMVPLFFPFSRIFPSLLLKHIYKGLTLTM